MPTESFESALKRAEQNQMTALELVGTAESFKQTVGLDKIAQLYQVWITHNQDNSLLYAILFNLSTILTDINEWNGAKDALERSTALNPEFAPSHINLGRLYERMGSTKESVAQWNSAIEKLPQINGMNIAHKITALNQMARVIEANQKDDLAEAMLFQSLEIDPHQREVIQHYLAARQRQCEWPVVQPWDRVTRDSLMHGMSPLSMAVYSDDPILQLASNWHYNVKDVGEPGAGALTSYWAAEAGKKNAPLRIGYLSSDLREHAIGFLTAEMFELHNRKNVEVFVYYCGIEADDQIKQRIKSSVDHWTAITTMDDAKAARQIADDGIQILIDVNGYTRDGRPKLLALRPAPVIVNWLGFPGSMASPYHHYIIADDWIIPPAFEKYYSEKVLRLPCYQPNDRKRSIAEQKPTRADYGLPEEAMVYCCFNGTQKISRFTIDRWIKILNRVPDSVLWLLSSTDKAQEKLLAYAETKGITKERILFADKKANPYHLARYPLADLFLDTTPYGAHTTASDALWMGVPVLTYGGRSFSSRVCGSLVRAAGLPELVCENADDFVDRAVALGKDKDVLFSYREKLAATRDSCVLFDTPGLIEHLESLFKEMWSSYQKKRLPQPDLSNLETYLEVGIRQDHEQTEVQGIDDYEGWWRSCLAKRNAYRPIAYDHRLWTKDAKKEQGEEQ